MTKYNPWDPDGDQPNENQLHDDNHRADHHDYSHPYHAPRPSGFTRLIIFLISIGLLIAGLAIAFPETSFLSDPYLVRGIIIVVIFGGIATYWSRSSIGRIMKSLGMWIVLITGLSFFYIFQSEFSDRFMSAVDPSGTVTDQDVIVLSRARDGHFWIRVEINDQPVNMMIDTGATNVVLSPKDAERIGIDLSRLNYNRFAETANGRVSFARTTVDHFKIGNQLIADVTVTVNGSDMKGSLLGNSLLRRYSSIEIKKNTMYLKP